MSLLVSNIISGDRSGAATSLIVTLGLDPRVHFSARWNGVGGAMDYRVKPGNDSWGCGLGGACMAVARRGAPDPNIWNPPG